MRTRSPVHLWLLLLLACFHSAAGAVHHAHCGGLGSAVAAVHAAPDGTPGDPASGAGHAACTACLLQAHGALPAAAVPTAWEPMALPAAPLRRAAPEDAPRPAPWRARFAARDPPEAA